MTHTPVAPPSLLINSLLLRVLSAIFVTSSMYADGVLMLRAPVSCGGPLPCLDSGIGLGRHAAPSASTGARIPLYL